MINEPAVAFSFGGQYAAAVTLANSLKLLKRDSVIPTVVFALRFRQFAK